MKNHRINSKKLGFLCAKLASVEETSQMRSILMDLCTEQELEAMADRIWVVPLLQEGHSYRAIYEKTGVSVTTIGRVAQAIRKGQGGYHFLFPKHKDSQGKE